MPVFSKLLRLGEGRMVKRLDAIATHVEGFDEEFSELDDADLQAKTKAFRVRLEEGETLDELLPEAFATAREAAFRVLGQKPYHVQIMGAAALHYGNIAEMKTGEGKTLTSVLAAYLNGLSGEGVHLVTTNDYLAKRDSEWMGRVHRFLGLTVDVILSGQTPEERHAAYRADITYGTNNEFGFDYLRDNMIHSLEELVQRGHTFAIVDEVDSILIDEARTPLIISGPADASSKWYLEFARIVPMMEKDVHYEVDIRKKTIGVHERGVELVEDQLGIDNLYDATNSLLVSYLNNAVKAEELYERDKDYIVRDGEVLIVDEFTGRVLDGRRFNEGMHQALEAKEKVEIQAENQTLATITLQNYFRLYEKLSGMTGTAETEAAELHQIYKLGVIAIPTNKPMIRIDATDLIYKTEEAKFLAVVDDITERHEKGQPVLVGTTSVERSEYLSRQLNKRKIPHNVLNAKFHEQEATIIAQAGTPGAVTVATNMAGRGTDVVLGGNPDILADLKLRKKGLDPVDTPEEYEAAWDDMIERVKEASEGDADKVREAGGLYVLGTERHESRRIDNQLRGRSGRQGDPGESRFYLSLGDELMRRFNGEQLAVFMNRMLPDDVPIENKAVSRAILSAQTQVEQQNFEVRKNVLKYDEVMNLQRKVIYAERKRILEGDDVSEYVQHMLDGVVGDYVDAATADGYVEDWDLDKLWGALTDLYPTGLDQKTVVGEDEDGERTEISAEELKELLTEDAEKAYSEHEKVIEAGAGEGAMRQVERSVLLSVLDQKWREHLYEMDYLKEGIGLRQVAQRDPLVEYQREGYDMFVAMLEGLKEESVSLLFKTAIQAPDEPRDLSGVGGPAPLPESAIPAALRKRRDPRLTLSGPREGGGTMAQAAEDDIVSEKAAPAKTAVAESAAAKTPDSAVSESADDDSAHGVSGDAVAVAAGDGARSASSAVSASRRERRAAERGQGKGPKPPKSRRRR